MLSLNHRVKRKLKRIRAKYIPKNIAYQPQRYKSVKEYTSHQKNIVVFKEVIPGYRSFLNISQDFYSRHSYDWPLEAEVAPTKIVRIKKGRLLTDTINVAIISGDNYLLSEVSYEYGNKIEAHSVLNQKYFNPPKKYDGVVYSMLIGGAGLDNYFHWFFDSLPKIDVLKKAGWFDEVDWFVVPSYSRPYQKETLKLLGIDEKKIIEGDKETHIVADEIISSTFIRTTPHIPAWTCDFIRSFSSKVNKASESTTYPYVYISREDASYRSVLNESVLSQALEKLGFKTVQLGKLSFNEQANLFASAKVIVTPHGAGLTNLVFCKHDTTVLELFAEDYIVYLYYDLALKLGLRYDYLFCDADARAVSTRQRMQQNMIVDVEKVLEKVKKLI